MPHEKTIYGVRRLPTLSDCPNNQRLPSPHITGSEDFLTVRLIILLGSQNVTPFWVGIDIEVVSQPLINWRNEPHCQQNKVCRYFEFAVRNFLEVFIDTATNKFRNATVFAFETFCINRKLPVRPFFLRSRCSHLHRPVRPDEILVFLLRRSLHDFKLRDATGALTERRADTVRTSIATTDNNHIAAL